MKEILDKISSYNFFNYLLPGIIFVVILDIFTPYSFIQEDIIIGLFIYYFIGLIISRLGSLVIEPILKHFSFLKFTDYNDFVLASKRDKKIGLFVQENNVYRTFVSMFFLVLFLKFYEFIEIKFLISEEWSLFILIILLLTIFIYSYRKQTNYIAKRINFINKQDI